MMQNLKIELINLNEFILIEYYLDNILFFDFVSEDSKDFIFHLEDFNLIYDIKLIFNYNSNISKQNIVDFLFFTLYKFIYSNRNRYKYENIYNLDKKIKEIGVTNEISCINN